MASLSEKAALQPDPVPARLNAWLCGVLGYGVLAVATAAAVSLLTWNIADPSLTHATGGPVRNQLGPIGAIVSDLVMQLLGLAGVFIVLPLSFWALQLIGMGRLEKPRTKLLLAPLAVLLLACGASSMPRMEAWPLPHNLGGLLGDFALAAITSVLATIRPERASATAGLFCFAGGLGLLMVSLGLSKGDLKLVCQVPQGPTIRLAKKAWRLLEKAWHHLGEMSERASINRREPILGMPAPFRPAPAAFKAPAPRPFVPERRPHVAKGTYPPAELHRSVAPTIDGEIEREKLDRILEICGPERAAKKAAERETPVIVRPEFEEPIGIPRHLEPAPTPPAVVAPAQEEPPRQARQRAARPAPQPAAPRPPMAPPADGWRPESLPGGDDLYGQAVMIVLDDRKPSATYLQRRLKIGYMRAADLIERMEREGILGAPIYKGMRPILIGSSGSREI
jgi:hypothetical protein